MWFLKLEKPDTLNKNTNIRNVKKLELKGDWAELGQKICLLRQTRTKYLEQNGVIQ